jgi:ADP-ribose pyrophosphatase
LLVKQFRLGANSQTIEIPAGILEPDEDPIEAVIRELREETGYRPLNIESLGGIFVAPAYTTNTFTCIMPMTMKKPLWNRMQMNLLSCSESRLKKQWQ